MNKKVMTGLGVLAGGAIALVFGGQAVVSHVAAKEIDQAIEEVSPFVNVEYKNVTTSFLKKGTQVNDVVITPVDSGESINVDKIIVYGFDTKDDIPTELNMAIKGMSLPTANLGENAAMFSELGYDKDISVDFATDYAYEEGNQTLRLKQFKVGADDVGAVEMSVHLANVSLDPAAIASMPISLFGAEFHGATLSYNDDSLMTRILDTTAAAEGVSVKDVQKEMAEGLFSDPEVSEALTPEQRKEIEKFINNPKAFTISMSPSEPVAFSSLMTTGGDSSAIAQLLNVSFKAN